MVPSCSSSCSCQRPAQPQGVLQAAPHVSRHRHACSHTRDHLSPLHPTPSPAPVSCGLVHSRNPSSPCQGRAAPLPGSVPRWRVRDAGSPLTGAGNAVCSLQHPCPHQPPGWEHRALARSLQGWSDGLRGGLIRGCKVGSRTPEQPVLTCNDSAWWVVAGQVAWHCHAAGLGVCLATARGGERGTCAREEQRGAWGREEGAWVFSVT